MNRRKNKTDQQFRDQLRHFEAVPPDQAWDGIASALHADIRKRRVLWVSRMAASVAVLLALGTTWFLLREQPESQLVNRETQEAGAHEETGIIKSEIPDTRSEVPEINRALNARTTSQESNIQETEVNLADADIPSANVGILTDAEVVAGGQPYLDPLKTVSPRSAKSLQTDYTDRGSLLAVTYHPSTLPGENVGIDVFDEWGDDRKTSHDKWGVGTQVSPIYSYRNLKVSDGSASGASYYNDVEDGIVSYAGGVNVHYAPLKRLSVQSGLYYSNMGMKVGNAYYASVDNKNSFFDETSTIQASINNSTGIIETQQGLDYAIAANSVPQPGWELASQNAMAGSLDAPEGEIL